MELKERDKINKLIDRAEEEFVDLVIKGETQCQGRKR
jgi:hypothetical protein